MTVKGSWNELMLVGAIRRKQWMTMGAVLMMMVGSLASQTAPQSNQRSNRITQAMSSGGIVTVAGTVHPLTQRATDLGAVNSNMQMDSLTLNIGLSAAQQTELNALLEAQQNAKSAQYHQWLTQEQYGARFGLTDADMSAVTAWLRGQGFTVKRVSTSRNAITFSGKAWQAESAFHTQLHQYQVDGETHFANATELRVPAGIGSVILNVRGLDNFRLKPHLRKVMKPVAPQFTSGSSGNHFLSPGDWAKIYNVNAIYAAGNDGTGAHVGVIGQTYAPQSDIDSFRAAAGLSTTKINYYCISSADCTNAAGISDKGDLGEADLDIEWAGGIAKNATVDYVYASWADPTEDVIDALQYAIQSYRVSGAVVPVWSLSYGGCEQDVTAGFARTFLELGQQANAQGQTIVVSSGDSGAAGCDLHSDARGYPAKLGISADFPASVPNVTGVGGTSFSGDLGNSLLYWNSTGGMVNSALAYIPEMPWDDTDSGGLAASGGGVSTLYPLPSWQWAPNNFPGTSGRFVPDVSFAASAKHDGYLTCTPDDNPTTNGNSCTSGFVSSKGYLFISGGTSASAPAFAGMLTLLTQKYGFLGNVNPTLYGLAKVPATYAVVFHDITSGNINVPCVTGTTGCVDGVMGYAATGGYDLATGLGSIDGGALYAALGGVSGLTTSTTVLVISPTAPTQNQTVTLMATVDSTSSSVTTTPTGAVVFTIDGTAGSAIQLANGSASTTMAFSTSGSHSVSVAYRGDTTFASSSASSAMTVTALPTYTFTVSATTPTITAGGVLPITLNLSSIDYAGTVSFATTVTSSNGTASNVTVNVPPPVTLTNGGNGVSTVTISTSAGAANHAPARPWKSGGALIFCAVLLGAPFTFRRKRALTVVLGALAISLAGFMMACGGGGNATQTPTPALTATTTAVSATPSTMTLNGTTSLAATVTPSTATGTVTFMKGRNTLGAATLASGAATLDNITVSVANGFASSAANSVTANYGGDSTHAASSGVGTVTVPALAPRVYTVTVTPKGTGAVRDPAAVTITVTVP